eukprot:TRINITY_DN267_c0_g1_i10.p2 TRINITY_DN267_c0_g1~~TRINITY_DN267_c0_g1_i10.p2  ORF type:complete len:130 (+),score=37.15 TRINITY_DN267_c0_g1_i10:53-391(+)
MFIAQLARRLGQKQAPEVVWLQGVVVSRVGEERFGLDDGTGVMLVNYTQMEWDLEVKEQMYVMVLADVPTDKEGDGIEEVLAYKVVDLGSQRPDAESVWIAEVCHAHFSAHV